jgi:hypothetical protein
MNPAILHGLLEMNISGDKNSITKDKHLLPITKEHLEHENKDTYKNA